MPRTIGQALGFLLGFWIAIWLSPLRVEIGRAAPYEAAGFAELEAGLLREVNAMRVAQHRIPLQRLPQLDRVARAHSADMARRSYLSHDTPEGRNPVDRIRDLAPPGFRLAAENIGITDHPAPNREILRSWLASPEHRRNLLAPAFNTTGVGIAQAADGALLYTQVYLTYPRVGDR
jgi:uncharacterized protein YkwD